MSSNKPTLVGVQPIFRHTDSRGSLQEVFRADWFPTFVPRQVNISFNRLHVLRGLHYHKLQTDVWFPIQGRFQCGFYSENEQRMEHLILDAMEPLALEICPGIAHGFLALDDRCILGYAVNQPYDPEDEYTLPWDGYGIPWRTDDPVLSSRDKGDSSVVD